MDEQTRLWTRITMLSLGAFALGTDGFVIAGILGHITSDLNVPLPVGGQLETAFALTVAIGAPLLAVLLSQLAPKRLMLVSLAVFVVGNALAVLAPSFTFLMLMRVVAGLGVAIYTPVAVTAAAMYAPPDKQGRALALVTAGMTAGIVLGVPGGVEINNLIDWRATFAFAAALGILALIGIAALFPTLPAPPVLNLRARLAMLKNPVVPVILANMAIWLVGGYTLYTYMGPVLENVTGLSATVVPLVFFLFGVASVLGNMVGGQLTDRWGANQTIALGLIGGGAGLVLVSAVATVPLAMIAALMLWSLAGWLLTPPQQHRLIGVAPQAAPILLSLNGSAIYLGIAGGAAFGAVVINHAGLRALGWTGALWEVLALAVLALSVRMAARKTPKPAAMGVGSVESSTQSLAS